MRFLFVVVCLLLLAGPTLADTDGIGVYFDRGARSSILFYPPGFSFEVFVCLTEPSSAEIYGLEFSYQLDVPEGTEGALVRLGNTIPPQAVDLGDNSDLLSGEYIVGLGVPLPSADAVVFVTWEFMQLEEIWVLFRLGPTRIESIKDGLPGYDSGGVVVPLVIDASVGPPSPVLSGGSSEGISACLNMCVVAVSPYSFGSIKALYR